MLNKSCYKLKILIWEYDANTKFTKTTNGLFCYYGFKAPDSKYELYYCIPGSNYIEEKRQFKTIGELKMDAQQQYQQYRNIYFKKVRSIMIKSISFIILISSFILIPFFSTIITARNTESIGNIVKINQSGVFCPTWEVELIRTKGFINGLNNNVITTTSGREEFFTVNNPKMLDQLKNAMETQQEIKIITHREFFTPCSSDSNTFVDSIEIINSK